MKVTLDLTKLLEEGRITKAEYDKLAHLGAGNTTSLAFNILIGFGVIAVSGGLIALLPDPRTAIAFGVVILAGGLGLYVLRLHQWDVLAHICVLLGALLLGAGLVILTNAATWTFLALAVGFAIVGGIARSGLLIFASVLALSSSLGARTAYWHATYMLGIEEPFWTIVVFSVLAIATYQLSKFLRSAYERLALTAARTSLLLVNLGFWIGSLWGDEIQEIGLTISDTVFAVVWALALLAVGIWAAMRNRQWVVNIVAVFAAIHFYTQWFERLGATPVSVLFAGVLALGFAVGLWYFNRHLWDRVRPAEAAEA